MTDAFSGHMPPLWSGGPAPGSFYPMTRPESHPPADNSRADGPRQHTTRPTVTGSSVLAVKFNGGVVVAADTLGSYGSLARFKNMSRLTTVGGTTVVGASGDMGDFQAMCELLEDLETENHEAADGHQLTPRAVHTYLTRVMYNKRSNGNPFWNSIAVGGVDPASGEAYLGACDKIGVAFASDTVGTGYGAHIALPLLRPVVEGNPELTQEEAVAEIHKCMKVLFYRDARSLNRYEVAVCTADGITISEPHTPETNWSIAPMVRGYE